MKFRKVLVTGDHLFLNRHKFLFEAMSPYFEQLDCLPSAHFLSEVKLIRKVKELLFHFTRILNPVKAERFYKNSRNFIRRSKQTERKIRRLEYTPDLVFHIFNLCSPAWDKFDIPYAMYLDYTMTLIKKNWSPGAPFNSEKEFATWLNCEGIAYQQASYLFVMSNLVKSSLIEDYGIEPAKITVVGSCGNVKEAYQGEKSFGSKQILFNGSEFERKGGDLVLTAFKQVKRVIPQAKLVIIGKKLLFREDGVDNPGRISSRTEMRNMFLNTDLVVSPARCDPFPTFLMEAMNYGIPCIGSNKDGMPEIIDHGVNGIVLEQLTPEMLANQIVNLLCNISALKSMSFHARHKIKTQLNCHETAKKISQVLLS